MGLDQIKNIWGIGRNYREHAAELNNPVPTSPLVFLKAGTCLQSSKDQLVFPFWLQDVQHEIELALQFGEDLKFSKAYLGMDFTDRELQESLKTKGHPWTLAKSFPGACAITHALPVANLEDLKSFEFSLHVNGQLRQSGRVQDMVFSLEFLMDYVQTHFPVSPGDLILTGTPSGVSGIKNGDVLEVSCSRDLKHRWTVHQPQARM